MIRAAYLRVYLPAEGRDTWMPHVGSQLAARVITVADIGVWEESLRDDAFRADWHGRTWVCPRYPRLRMLEGLLAFRNSYSGIVATALAPERVVVRAAAELEALYSRDPQARSHILTSSWHVPLRWFVAFTADERELAPGPDGQQTIRYRTELAQARTRLEEAVGTLDDVGFEDSIVDQVRDVEAWLADFPNDAMVELDYASVAGLFSDGDLALDESAADIFASLEALRSGDIAEAGTHYAAAASRWSKAQSMTYAN